ncbi:hypothetical protein RJ640_002721 [Escallonia rubra]|uniref:Uncharacterized protein n=1 Tax=Escallonia rubra TaxID=112253 RepID=A0AA88RKU5_9ASTE|nr:hypothetical protein RJ640_002717 [Escallonia rubra]KAK2984487.1 hypothetical protein RJ640_002719 [Escallonia rubra]KAK2984489.1 hypothetical protein RJ640_002721 [Escallonia rubra]
MESKYVACSVAVQEVVLGVTAHADEIVTVYYDDIVDALDFAKDLKYHGKAKYVDLRYHFIRTLVT